MPIDLSPSFAGCTCVHTLRTNTPTHVESMAAYIIGRVQDYGGFLHMQRMRPKHIPAILV